MTDETLGAGISLDESFDFELSGDGDIETVDGTEEINKDLALALTVLLDGFEGAPLTPDTSSRIREITRTAILADSRVDAVTNVSVTEVNSRDGSFSAKADYLAGGTEQELIIDV